jgi:23S rRNA (uracil1939-C5)-methyltransferase
MLTIVSRSADAVPPYFGALLKRLREAAPNLKGVASSPNPERGNAIFGPTCQTLWGESSLTERLEMSVGTLRYDLSPRSFFQVNTSQAERLVETVLAYADAGGGRTAADIYCGAGTLTLALAKAGFDAAGVELLPDAVSDARRNAAANGMPGVTFECGDAARVLPALLRTRGRFDVITLDPPRKGCDPVVLESAASARPDRLIYVSCDPATLARDAAILSNMGYRLTEATPIDQFCWTTSAETVALFMNK